MPYMLTAIITVKPDAVDRFKARFQKHAAITKANEKGCRLFAAHQDKDEATVFLAHEIYDDAAAFEVHKNSSHLKQFRDDTKDWVVDRKIRFWNQVA